jgi:hypothetical protein
MEASVRRKCEEKMEEKIYARTSVSPRLLHIPSARWQMAL